MYSATACVRVPSVECVLYSPFVDSLTAYFNQFGEVEDVDLKKDAYDLNMHR